MKKIFTINNVFNNCELIIQDDLTLISNKILSNIQSDNIFNEIKLFFEKNNVSYEDIDILSITNGPGSFTMLKALISFAKGFKVCFKDKKIITNNLFEILSFGKDYDLILLEVINTIYIFDKNKYFFIKQENLNDLKIDNIKIITNSKKIVDLFKNHISIILCNFEILDLINLNFKKMMNCSFDCNLEPLYIREPDINLKIKNNNK